jgi:lipopolysaccharide biosynthesis regulator YciM
MKKTILIFLLIFAGSAFYFMRLGDRSDISANVAHPPLESKDSASKELPSPYSDAEQAIVDTRLEEAQEIFESLLQEDPQNFEARYGLGVVHSLSAEYEKASETLHDAVLVNPDILARALEDERLVDLRSHDSFHHLLRMHNIEIPEMYPGSGYLEHAELN